MVVRAEGDLESERWFGDLLGLFLGGDRERDRREATLSFEGLTLVAAAELAFLVAVVFG